jgi:hypothetical protein
VLIKAEQTSIRQEKPESAELVLTRLGPDAYRFNQAPGLVQPAEQREQALTDSAPVQMIVNRYQRWADYVRFAVRDVEGINRQMSRFFQSFAP